MRRQFWSAFDRVLLVLLRRMVASMPEQPNAHGARYEVWRGQQ